MGIIKDAVDINHYAQAMKCPIHTFKTMVADYGESDLETWMASHTPEASARKLGKRNPALLHLYAGGCMPAHAFA